MPGQEVKVMVVEIDAERERIGLSLRRLQANPWETIDQRYSLGQLVSGPVTNVAPFGAFVQIEEAVEGLIHISELAPQRVFRVSDIVKPEQEVQVKVLSVDPAQRRISLSLKAAQAKAPEPEPEEEAEAEPPAPVKPPRPRTTPLRGGTGSSTGQLFPLPKPPSKDDV